MAETTDSPTSTKLSSSITKLGSTTLLFKEVVVPKKDFNKEQFFQRVQIHGLTDWYNANSFAAKTFWVLVVVFFTAVLTVTIRRSVEEYYINPIKTTISYTANNTLAFPYVQICPANFIDWEIERPPHVVEEVLKFIAKPTGNILDDLMMKMDIPPRPVPRIHSNTLTTVTPIVKRVSYAVKKFLVACEFNTDGIPCTNITTRILDRNLGMCYSIASAGIQKISKSGLRVLVDLHVEKASVNFPTPLEGVYVRVSKHIDAADATSTLVAPGKYAKLAVGLHWVKLVNIRRSKTPQICVEHTEEEAFNSNYEVLSTSYSEFSCREDCLQSIILRECGCLPLSDPRFIQEKHHNRRPCKVKGSDKNCSEVYVPVLEKAALRSCFEKCYRPCQAWHFEIRQSSMNLGSYGAIESYRVSQLDKEKGNNTGDDDRDKNPEISRRSKILLDIAFDQLEFESVEQSQAKTLVELVSDIGGQTGLWLGASMVTIIQMLAMLLAWTYTKIIGGDSAQLKQ